MAWTVTQRDALQAAIAKGVKTVKYADREITYHSMQEMRDLLSAMEQDIAQAGGQKSVSYAQFERD